MYLCLWTHSRQPMVSLQPLCKEERPLMHTARLQDDLSWATRRWTYFTASCHCRDVTFTGRTLNGFTYFSHINPTYKFPQLQSCGQETAVNTQKARKMCQMQVAHERICTKPPFRACSGWIVTVTSQNMAILNLLL
jgi:hypothetical protein